MKKDDIKYAIVTEGADFNFPYLRVMLNSLLKHNGWVKDNIVIMTCDLTPLSSHNREILKSINDKIQFVDIDSKYFSNIKIKNKNQLNRILISLYRLNCFNLKTFDLALYISSYNVCTSSIVSLFEEYSNVSLADTGGMAQTSVGSNQKILGSELNSSVMLISNQVTSGNMLEKSLGNINKIRRLTDKSIDQVIQDSLNLEKVDYSLFGLNLIIKKSKFPDSKFKDYQAIQKMSCIINMDIELSKNNNARFMFKRINSIWNSYNKQGDWDTGNFSNTPKDIINTNIRKFKDGDFHSKFCVMITTYNRPLGINRLTEELKKLDSNCRIVVVDDASNTDVDLNNIDEYVKLPRNNGKKGWWKTVNTLWKKAISKNHEYYIMMPDDALPKESFFNEAERLWKSIGGPVKIALHLANNNREKNWTNFPRREYSSEIFLTQTTEFSFICKRDFISYTIPEIPLNTWDKNPLLGSGVGPRLNRYWVKKGRKIYGVKKSLIKINLDCQESVMNPKERKKNPWIIK